MPDALFVELHFVRVGEERRNVTVIWHETGDRHSHRRVSWRLRKTGFGLELPNRDYAERALGRLLLNLAEGGDPLYLVRELTVTPVAAGKPRRP